MSHIAAIFLTVTAAIPLQFARNLVTGRCRRGMLYLRYEKRDFAFFASILPIHRLVSL